MPDTERHVRGYGFILVALGSAAVAAPARDGILDPSFGNSGIARFQTLADGAIAPALLNRIVPLAGGHALLLGAGRRPGTSEPLLPLVVRIDRHGAPDPSFGTAGAYLLPALPGIDLFGARAFGAAVLGDGRIVVVSGVAKDKFSANTSYDDCAWVFAVTSSGSLIADYGPTGAPGCVDFGDSSGVTYQGTPPVGSIAVVDADGRVLVGGYPHDLPGSGESALARLAPDGRLDLGFGTLGRLRFGGSRFVQPSVAPGFLAGASMLLAPAGAGAQRGVARFGVDGVLDLAYGDQGFAGANWTTLQDAGSFIGGIALDRQGRALIAGYSRTFFGGGMTICDACISRFLSNGNLDLAFNASGAWPGTPGSALIAAVPQGAAAALSVLARGDGRVILAGTAGGMPGGEQLWALALREDATLATRFGSELTPGHLQLTLSPTGGGTVFGDAALASDGGALLGGWLADPGGGIAVARLVDDLVFGDSVEDPASGK